MASVDRSGLLDGIIHHNRVTHPTLTSVLTTTTTGSIAVSSDSELTVIPPGTAGQYLTPNPSVDGGLEWTDLPASVSAGETTGTTKGAISAGTGTGLTSITPGTAGQYLTPNTGATGGLEWTDLPASVTVNETTGATEGAIAAGTGTGLTSIAPGTAGQYLTPNSGVTGGLEWTDLPSNQTTSTLSLTITENGVSRQTGYTATVIQYTDPAMVTLLFPQSNLWVPGGGSTATLTPALSVALRPADQQFVPLVLLNNAASEVGNLFIDLDGSMQIQLLGATTTFTSASKLYPFTATYLT